MQTSFIALYQSWQTLLAWPVSAADGFIPVIELDDVVFGYAGDEATSENMEHLGLAIADIIRFILFDAAGRDCWGD